MEITELLDDSGAVASRDLAFNMIKTALISLESAGNIALEITNGNTNVESKSILINPLVSIFEFPENTLEYRLMPSEARPLFNIISDWLIVESNEPFTRATEQGKIMLVIRGLASFSVATIGGESKYLFSEMGILQKAATTIEIDNIKKLLNDCESNRPEIWNLLDIEIAKAFDSKTLSKKNKKKSDENPWLNESEDNREKYYNSQTINKKHKYSHLIILAFGIGFGYLWYFIINQISANSQHQMHVAIIIASILALIFFLSAIKFKPIVYIGTKIKTFTSNKNKKLPIKDQTPFEKFCTAIFGVSFLGFFLHIIFIKVQDSHLLGIIILAAIAFFIYKIIQKNAIQAINEKVVGKTITPLEKTILEDELPSINKVANNYTNIEVSTKNKPVTIEIIASDKLPNPSAESLKRLEAIYKRGPEYYKLIRKTIFFIATGTFTLWLLYYLGFGPNSLFNKTSNFHFTTSSYFFIGFYFFSIGMLNPRFFAWATGLILRILIGILSVIIGGQASGKIQPIETDESKSLRPITLIALAWIWFICAINITDNCYTVITSSLIAKYILIILSLVISIWVFIWMKKSKSKLEKKYPYYPPLNMLALRVFGSPYLTQFLALTEKWKSIGTTQRLDGPETVGYKESDVFNYLTGRIDKSIIENDNELNDILKKFNHKPDKKLHFSLNSMQCNDATWKNALQNLLDDADIVVMDLSNLSASNRGVAYEIQKMFDQFSKEKILFLINDSTDTSAMHHIINQAWNSKSENSPNRKDENNKITVYHTGVMPAINKGESIYDWKKRFETLIDGDKLVALLYDKSHPLIKTKPLPDPKKDKNAIHWTKIPMPHIIKIILKISLAIYFISSFLSIIKIFS